MTEDKFSILRTKPADEEFHRSRIIFCIKDDKVEVASSGIVDSHLEWFEREGWATEENREQFLEQTVRGFYFPENNCLYCYTGIGFWFDDEVISTIIRKLAELKEALNLKNDTKICFGPKDSPLENIEYPRHCEGILKELLQK